LNGGGITPASRNDGYFPTPRRSPDFQDYDGIHDFAAVALLNFSEVITTN
jgi:hypothetical protein